MILYTDANTRAQAVDEDNDYKRGLSNLTSSIQQRDYTDFGGSLMAAAVVAAFYGQSNRATQERAAWDTLIGSTNLDSDSYLSLFADNADYDPAVILEQTLCEWNYGQTDINDFNSDMTEACSIEFGSSNSKRDEEHRKLLEKRIFAPRTNHQTSPTTGGNSAINVGALLDRILNTPTVPVLYARLTDFRGQDANLEGTYLRAIDNSTEQSSR